ncbi:alpha-ribazole phosphatase [Spongiibacter sp. KMU-158]|uniref:Alpha-ribazole phosphatase n=1 Tax=Spongiibacter pelagi TaxID=2760804 RepID=A0A927C5G5_9GAMM|nr:alpha-ribazole phosphatase [Spongiibacter pelagi]MBD2859765.1 alpha-ribazole phosphatase [Spongiibacter pelagi]
MAKTTVTRVDLLRHGACEGGEIFRGSTDVALSELGWQQMRDKAREQSRDGKREWTQIISSPLIRCVRFAEELSEQKSLPIAVCENFREMHFGDWEGLPHAEAQQRYPQEWKQFWQSPAEASPPNGESMPAFCERVTTALDQVVADHQNENLLLVVHGAVIRVMMCHWLGMPMGAMTRLSVPYASMSRFEVYQQEGRPAWVQLHSHG